MPWEKLDRSPRACPPGDHSAEPSRSLDFDGPRARRNPQLRDFIIRDVCGGDLGYFRALSPMTLAETAAAPIRDRKTVIRQAVGTRDDTRDLNRQFHERMTALGIDHGYHEIPDVGHDAAAVLAALAVTDGDFYRRVLTARGAQDRVPTEAGERGPVAPSASPSGRSVE